MSACIFCRIAAGELGTELLLADDQVVAFRDLNPQAPVHALVIPRRHLSSLNDPADDALLGRVMSAAREVAAQLGVAQSGYRVVLNTGPNGGQSVFHLHAHVLGGRPLGWPPG